MINLDEANDTLDAMTQLMIRYRKNNSLAQIFNTNDSILGYNHITSNVFINTLFVDNATKSKHKFTCD